MLNHYLDAFRPPAASRAADNSRAARVVAAAATSPSAPVSAIRGQARVLRDIMAFCNALVHILLERRQVGWNTHGGRGWRWKRTATCPHCSRTSGTVPVS